MSYWWDYDFNSHKELVGVQSGGLSVTYADSEALEHDYMVSHLRLAL